MPTFPTRHGRTWSDHPRVSMSNARSPQANSWMVVPSTTMTKGGWHGATLYQFRAYFLRLEVFFAAGLDLAAAFFSAVGLDLGP